MTAREVIYQCRRAGIALGNNPNAHLSNLRKLGLLSPSDNGAGYAIDTVSHIRRIRNAQRADKIPLQYMKVHLDKEDGA